MHVGQYRHLPPDLVEVFERKASAGAAGQGNQVDGGIGRAAQGHDDGNGILKSLAGHDISGFEILFQQVPDGRAYFL